MGEMGMGELPSPELAPPPVPSSCTPPPSGDDLSGVHRCCHGYRTQLKYRTHFYIWNCAMYMYETDLLPCYRTVLLLTGHNTFTQYLYIASYHITGHHY